MATLADEILQFVSKYPGRTDREIAEGLRGRGSPQQPVNQAARLLQRRGVLTRKKRADGFIGNYLTSGASQAADSTTPVKTPPGQSSKNHDLDALSEDEIKSVLVDWLAADGWTCEVAWGRARGIDIDARKSSRRRIIEVKGPGSRPEMRVNYFLGMLGETLQRMSDPDAQYLIAMPDLPQFRKLWERLPALAKSRTQIDAVFVSKTGEVHVVE